MASHSFDLDGIRRLVAGAGLAAAMLVSQALAEGEPDIRAILDQAREISYHAHWQEAQALLDELAPFIDQAELREYADFQLLQARHLVLDDRTEEALALAGVLLERDLPTDQRLRALQFRANVGVLLRRYETAFESLSEALNIDVDLEDPAPVIATLNMAAYMFGRVGEHELGIEYGEQALAIADRTDQPKEACVALQRLAPVYKWADRAAESEAAYREGIRICDEVDNALFVGVLQHGLADLLRRQGQAGIALPLAEAAITALDEAVYRLGEFEARLVRVEILRELGRLDAAWRDELIELRDFFSDRGLWDQSARLTLLQSKLAEASGQFDLALQRLYDHLHAREQFLGRERAMRLAYLQVEFDSRMQRQQIDLLRETARAAELEAQTAVQQRRLRSFGWLLVGLVVLTLSSLLLRAFAGRRQLIDQARHDGLSGLANHTWFFERAQTMIDQARAGPGAERIIVLIAADIDHFKEVNDRHGHRMGDRVLGRTAQRLREVFPDTALVGRIGGEEFAVLLSVARVEEAIDCIERFRRTDTRFVGPEDPPITVSFGLSCARAEDDIHRLRARADQAMYRAKRAGRDRYEIDASCLPDQS
ncbi:GGDEF domain-containing protein [Wenzhouxiangella marina]|uniref:GGDEF domain-containing protein n=1 Tax=Wenzhouxiangella marina TaxID=1579979 RepID=UPI000673C0DE|nr:GGDEF domain-containing protein [Wenzhouxiangella marina]MBB6088261.1 diguanylate cyclase (GGDEF)-like protein [Wenzhouxiangella marina]